MRLSSAGLSTLFSSGPPPPFPLHYSSRVYLCVFPTYSGARGGGEKAGGAAAAAGRFPW